MEGKVGTGFNFENGGVGFEDGERVPFVGKDFGDEIAAFAGKDVRFAYAPVVVVNFQTKRSREHDEGFLFWRVQVAVNRHNRSRLKRVHEFVDGFVHRFVKVVIHAQARACFCLCVNVVENLLRNDFHCRAEDSGLTQISQMRADFLSVLFAKSA